MIIAIAMIGEAAMRPTSKARNRRLSTPILEPGTASGGSLPRPTGRA
jgi:hypothetical protein